MSCIPASEKFAILIPLKNWQLKKESARIFLQKKFDKAVFPLYANRLPKLLEQKELKSADVSMLYA